MCRQLPHREALVLLCLHRGHGSACHKAGRARQLFVELGNVHERLSPHVTHQVQHVQHCIYHAMQYQRGTANRRDWVRPSHHSHNVCSLLPCTSMCVSKQCRDSRAMMSESLISSCGSHPLSNDAIHAIGPLTGLHLFTTLMRLGMVTVSCTSALPSQCMMRMTATAQDDESGRARLPCRPPTPTHCSQRSNIFPWFFWAMWTKPALSYGFCVECERINTMCESRV